MAIVTLGLAIDSSAAVAAKKNLDALTAAAKPAAQAAAKLSEASSAGTAALSAHTNAAKGAATAHAGLSTQAMAAQHSIRSMVEMLAMGIPPTQVLTSQMNHLSYAATGPGGLKVAFTDALGSFRSFLSPTTAIVGGLAAITAGAALAVNSVAKLARQFEDSARAAGTSLTSLQGFAAAASFKGISNADFLTSMDKFASSVYDAKNGMGGLAEVFRANNKSAKDFNGYLATAADLVKATGSDQQRLQMLQQMGLPATMQWVKFLSQGKDAIAAQTTEFMKTGDQMDALAAKAEAFQEKWDTWVTGLKTGFQGFTLSIVGFFDNVENKLTSVLMQLPKIGSAIPTNVLRNALNDNGSGYYTGSKLTGTSPVDQFYTPLGKNAPGNSLTDGSVDKDKLLHDMQLQTPCLGMLGKTQSAQQSKSSQQTPKATEKEEETDDRSRYRRAA